MSEYAGHTEVALEEDARRRAQEIAAENLSGQAPLAEPEPPTWDVFGRTKASPVLVFGR